MKNVVELLNELPFKAKAKENIVLNNKFSEIETIYKGETVLITNIDLDISLAWWFKFDKVVIEGIVKRTAISTNYEPPTIKDQSWSPMFEERPFEFIATLPSSVSINEFLEVL